MIETAVFNAPFTLSWLPVWVFAGMGGLCSIFFKIPSIDIHFRYLLFAKPLLGTFGAVSLCLFVTKGVEPPEVVLPAYAFLAALLSAPLLQNTLAVVSVPKNNVSFLNAVNPFKFKLVPNDEVEKKDDKP